MKSRIEKYYNENPQYRRITKNADLYKEVYKSYSNIETLPIADNTNEIDIEELQKLVRESRNRTKRNMANLEEEQEPEIRKDEQREYDINKILEKVKNENNKIKEITTKEPLAKRNYLATLKSEELPISKIKEAYLKQEVEEILEKENHEDEKIYMTRELKFKEKQLEVTREIEILKQTENSSPLDLFEDLKPSGNTFITEPVKPEKDNIFSNTLNKKEEENKPKIEKIESGYKEDYDIDIIKKQSLKSNKEEDDDFYTDSYKFSKKDFVDDEDDDFYDKPKKSSGILKIVLLLALILALSTTIYYFINKYGIGV